VIEFITGNIIYLLAAVVVGVLGVGRLSRAIYYDAFPPSIWLRTKWDLLTEESSWNLLLHCPWCLTHWIAAGSLAVFVVGIWVPWVAVVWWVWHVWFAISYLASMVIVRDEPAEEEE
jgi:hypothetical protein